MSADHFDVCGCHHGRTQVKKSNWHVNNLAQNKSQLNHKVFPAVKARLFVIINCQQNQ